jgi:hypothetical protein
MLGVMGVGTGQWRRARDWTDVYVANVFLPLVIGGLVTSNGGSLGMLCAVLTIWAVGLVVCTRAARLGRVLFAGGKVVAVCQLFPVLQVVSACCAFWAWNAVGGTLNRGGLMSEVGGFAVTLLTAQPLLLAAFVFGGGHRLLIEWRDDGD